MPEEEVEGLVGLILTYPLHVVRGMDVRRAQLHERVEDLVEHLQGTQRPLGMSPSLGDPRGLGHLSLQQVAQSHVQPDTEPLQGWGTHSFTGQPVPVPRHPHRHQDVGVPPSSNSPR